MFRVARVCPVVAVVAPVPWFPLQGLIRRLRPHYRPPAPRREVQDGVDVYHPRFLAVPGLMRGMDGAMLALACRRLVRRLCRDRGVDLIDAHFGYPDGYAAVRLGRWLGKPVTVTLRGTEPRHSRTPGIRPRLLRTLREATRLISVSDSLRRVALELGAPAGRITVVGNGIDTRKFHPEGRAASRERLGLDPDARVLVTVGGLCERKGFHRVIELLPALRRRLPDLHYLVVGGPSPEGDWSARLREMAARAGLEHCVHFLGPLSHDRIRTVLSAADLFVLATRNEGWANVILEAMACGIPVVATDVGGNREVVASAQLGEVVPFGDADALRRALERALAREWDRRAIVEYARANSWDVRVEALRRVYHQAVEAVG
jgi:glycosyltransferase involved in cell wall biosynthesis